MRQKIQDIIRGKFEYDSPALLLEEEDLYLPVIENEIYHGSFHLKSSNGQPVRGIVTCEHPSISISSPEFDAAEAEIRFSFSGKAISDDEKEPGVFVVTSSAGEFLFPFTVQTSRHYLSTSIGKIKTLNDFYNLCKLNWDEALDVFSSRYFCNIFHENTEYYKLLYHSVTQQKCSSHELEEFLIATGKKNRCSFYVEGKKRSYYIFDRPLEDSITVKKSEWGYCDIRISCPESFVELGKTQLQMYDFFGKHTDFSFKLRPERMHKGRNFASITLQNGFHKETIVLECIVGDLPKEHSDEWVRKYHRYQLEGSYLSYLLGEKSETEWILESIDMISHAMEEDPKNRWLNLFLAYLYYEAKDYSRMEEQMRMVPRNMRNSKTPLSAMYHYLLFLCETEEDRATVLARVDEIMYRYRKNPILNWIYLRLDDSLERSPERKYDAIRQFMKSGSTCPIFYLEAARILQEYPEFLNSNDDFDCRLLGWMSKKNLLTRELAMRVQGMAQGKQRFNRNYLRVLSKCFKKFGDPSYIKSICVYLIHTNCYGETYFPWFRRGVQQHLKIAGLYEAYILSWSRSQGELPAEIVRYFSMSSTLPARRKAMLYAYIVRNKNRLENDWPDYISLVREFAVSELQKNHMNDDLAIIYEEIRRMMTKEEWDEIKNDAESSYKVHVGKTDFQAVRVTQNLPEMQMQRTAISGDSAYIHLYCTPYVILYEGKDGLLYVPGRECRVSKMLPGNRLPRMDAEEQDIPKKRAQESPIPDPMERFENLAGPIDEMCDLVLDMQDKGVDVLPQAQQLMIRMLFTGHLGRRHNEIFRILKKDHESEELLSAYVSVLCRDLMLKGTPLDGAVYLFLWESLSTGNNRNPFYKAAFLHMFAEQPQENYEDLAERMMREYLFAGIYFPCFSRFPDPMRLKYLLMGIQVVSYRDKPGEAFYIQFSNGTRESVEEVLPGLYTYPLKILPGEKCEYSIVDAQEKIRARESLRILAVDEEFADTRYGILGSLQLNDLDVDAQHSYAEKCDLVNTLFVPTEE